MADSVSGLNVFVRDRVCGRLGLDERRRFVFAYAPGWLREGGFPLSLSLPLRPEPYDDDEARPFFANLLPEGELRPLIARRLGVSPENSYALLEKIGGDCAGAVSLLPHSERPLERSGYRELDEEGLSRVLEELPRRPFLAGEAGVRLSLAGAQSKLPVYVEEGRVFIATGSSPSTHILKPPIPGFAGTVENEAFCMALARELGLPAAEAVIRKGRDTVLVVTRYDREREEGGGVLQVHQEDFCQALGVLPEQKYESEGGPSLEDCFALLERASVRPAADRQALLGWVVFNALAGNADGHAKNLSLMLAKPGPRLAPFYDLLSTAAYPELSSRPAMRIGGEDRPEWVQPRHWDRLADAAGLKRRYVQGRVRDMASRIVPLAERLARGFAETEEARETVDGIVEEIRRRAGRM